MLMELHPCWARPLFTSASAARFTLSADTAPAKQFQLFQPIGGVSAMVSPQTMRNFSSAAPSEFFARRVTLNSPGFFNLPVIWPVLAFSFKPRGRLSAENFMGRSPVAGIVNKNGEPGRTPKIFAPLMRGVSGAGGVRISAAGKGTARATVRTAARKSNDVFNWWIKQAAIIVMLSGSVAGYIIHPRAES